MWERAIALAESAPSILLQGSLARLGLLPLMRFLRSIEKTGCLHLSRDGWHGQLWLESGVVVGASFGGDGGLAALDAILLVLSQASFAFVEEPLPANSARQLRLDLDELAAYQARIPAHHRRLAASIPSPSAVPQFVSLPEDEAKQDPTEFVLPVGTLRTLLAIDGERTIQELSQDCARPRVLLDLALLKELGLIRFEVWAARAADQTAQPRLVVLNAPTQNN
jgi:hypothetical protein